MYSKIKILKKPDVTDLAGEKVMIDFETGKYFLLKGVANDIWDMMADDVTVEEICSKLLEEYDVDEQTCKKEVVTFLKNMEDHQFIKIEE